MECPCDLLRGAGKNTIEPPDFIKFLAPHLNYGAPSKKSAGGPWPPAPCQAATESEDISAVEIIKRPRHDFKIYMAKYLDPYPSFN